MRSRRTPTAVAALAIAACLVGALDPVVARDPQPPVVSPADPAPSVLRVGESLVAETAHDELRHGAFSLVVVNGQVEVRESRTLPGPDGPQVVGTGTWFRTGQRTPGGAGRTTRLRLTRRGDLALTMTGPGRLWHSGTAGRGVRRLTLRRNGDLTLDRRDGRPVWRARSGQVLLPGGSTLGPGERLQSAWETGYAGGRTTTLVMRRGGDLVHRCGRHVDWRTGTEVPGSRLRLLRNGALRVVGPHGRTLWASGSGGGDHDYVHLDAKLLRVYAAGRSIWTPRTRSGYCP